MGYYPDKPEYWTCKYCLYENFVYQTYCRKCNKPRFKDA